MRILSPVDQLRANTPPPFPHYRRQSPSVAPSTAETAWTPGAASTSPEPPRPLEPVDVGWPREERRAYGVGLRPPEAPPDWFPLGPQRGGERVAVGLAATADGWFFLTPENSRSRIELIKLYRRSGLEIEWENLGRIVVTIDGRKVVIPGETFLDHKPDYLTYAKYLNK